MDLVNLTVFALLLLVVLYKNWIPGLYGWVSDRVRE